MSEGIYITAHAAIHHQKVFKDGKLVFESGVTGTGAFLLEVYQALEVKYPKFYKMDNLSKLGWLTAEWLLGGNKTISNYPAMEVGLVISNASSSLDADARYFESVKEIASPSLFVYTLPNIVIGEICIRHQFKGENAFFIAEKFDAEFLNFYASNLLNHHDLQACICGWVECLGTEYQSVLFLVEKQEGADGADKKILSFSSENLNHLYKLYNG